MYSPLRILCYPKHEVNRNLTTLDISSILLNEITITQQANKSI